MPVGKDFMETLYLRYRQLMLLTAGRYFSAREDREDVVQDAVLRLLRHSDKLTHMEEKRVPGYIVFTVRSAAVDLLRKRSRTPESSREDAEPAGAEDLVLDRVILQEELDRLRAVWPSLSPEDQLVLEGKYIWGCGDEELAQALGCRKDSVRMLLTRARRRALGAMRNGKGGETR